MKKYTKIILSILILIVVSGCGSTKETIETVGNAVEIAASIVVSQNDIPQLSVLEFEDDFFVSYLSYYDLDKTLLEDGAIGYAGGVEASEIAVLVVVNENDAEIVEKALISYIGQRVDSFRGYVPDQAALAEDGIVVVNGRYVALIISKDNDVAREVFMSCFDENWLGPTVEDVFIEQPTNDVESEHQETENQDDSIKDTEETSSNEEVKDSVTDDQEQEEVEDTTGTIEEETPSNEEVKDSITEDQEEEEVGDKTDPIEAEEIEGLEDKYDKDAVLAVWLGGDINLLSEKNLRVYKEAVYIIEQVITSQMNDLDKELAIHDYIIDNGKYDPEAISNAPDASPDLDNDNPYGMLVNGVGICSGYTSTFQLLMDMLNIKCITVDGFSGSEPHAWNMVQLEGLWYCVDVTWDDTDSRHRFFNVTSQFMRETNHQWDATNVPEAITE